MFRLLSKTFFYCLTGMFFAFKVMATEPVSAPNLGDVLSELNQKVVHIEGNLSGDSTEDKWLFEEQNTDVIFFKVTMLVRPSDLRMLREGCTSHPWGDRRECKIKALAELDTSRKQLDLIIFQLLEADIPPKSGN